MRATTIRRPPLRRAIVACVAAVTALAVSPTTASAQAPSPRPTPLDDLCAEMSAADPFVDVGEQSWADAVRCLAHAGITRGVSTDRYGPLQSVTRQQMATFIAGMMNVATNLETGDRLTNLSAFPVPNQFGDVALSSTHLHSINRLAEAGVARGGPGGRPADRYGPDLPVTRGQMATFITRALEHLTGVDRSTDVDHFGDDDGSAHEENINALAQVGVVAGYGDGSFRPDAPVTRAQMASFLLRPMANLEQAGVITAFPAKPATDVPLAIATGRFQSNPGVVTTDADGSIRHVVSTDPGAVAYAVGPDLVVYQEGPGWPGVATPYTDVLVWSEGTTKTLPAPEDATFVTLLDAATVDGSPVALVREELGIGSDMVSQLVLIDVETEERTTIAPADGSMSHSGGRLLPDGDAVVIAADADAMQVTRLSAGADAPVWGHTIPYPSSGDETFPRPVDIAVLDGEAVVIYHGMDQWHMMATTTYDVGTGNTVRDGDVKVPAFGELARQCEDLLSPTVLVCARDQAPAVAVDLTSGLVSELPGGDNALVTAVRSR